MSKFLVMDAAVRRHPNSNHRGGRGIAIEHGHLSVARLPM